MGMIEDGETPNFNKFPYYTLAAVSAANLKTVIWKFQQSKAQAIRLTTA